MQGMDSLMQVRKVFNSAQDGVVVSKLCKQLYDMKPKLTEDEFWHAFHDHLQKAMIYYRSEINVERVIELCAEFATYPSQLKTKESDTFDAENSMVETMDSFLLRFFQFLIDNHNSRSKAVRYRCCQLITKIFTKMSDSETIDEDLSDSLYECMMIRMKDKFAQIRVQAVLALVRLQDPGDEGCPVIDAFLTAMDTDANAEVRKTIISNIALSRKILPYLVARSRDCKDANRKATFMVLSEKVSVRALTIAQRISLLSQGLKDRSPVVKQSCVQLLKQWLTFYKQDMVKLLSCLDIESNLDCSRLALEALFKGESVGALKNHYKTLFPQSEGNSLPPVGTLSPELVYLWYMVCKHLSELGGGDGEVVLQQLLPELSVYSDFIRTYTERNFIDSALLAAFDGMEEQQEFILEHLLNIASFMDFSDEVGRNHLQELIFDLLSIEYIPLSSVNVIVKLYRKMEGNEERFISKLVEIIADIKQPMKQVVTTAMKETRRRIELQVARVKMNLIECTGNMESAIKEQNFEQAAMLKCQVAELEQQKSQLLVELDEDELPMKRVEKDDPETIIRCLTVASSMMQHLKKTELCPTLISLNADLTLKGIPNEDPSVRSEAVKCLGLIMLLSKQYAVDNLLILVNVLRVDKESLQIMAAQVLFDVFMVYDLRIFDVQEEEESVTSETKEQGNTAASVLKLLVAMLDSECEDLRSVVVEGMAKLLLTGRLSSCRILARLILLWYNPVTEGNVKLRHCLAVFFQNFAFAKRENQAIMEETFMPVFKTLVNSPSTSPLSQVNVTNVTDLLVHLTDVKNCARPGDTDSHVHDSLALNIANEIMEDPDAAHVKLLAKILNQLNICRRNTMAINDLREISLNIIDLFEKNSLIKRMVERFYLKLQANSPDVSQDAAPSVACDETASQPESDQASESSLTFAAGKHKLSSSAEKSEQKKVKLQLSGESSNDEDLISS